MSEIRAWHLWRFGASLETFDPPVPSRLLNVALTLETYREGVQLGLHVAGPRRKCGVAVLLWKNYESEKKQGE